MNAELAKKILEILQSSQTFVVSQAPDVVQQLVKYEVAKVLLGIGVGLILCAVAVGIIIWAQSNGESPAEIFGIVPGVPGIVLVSVNVCTLLELWLAPKLFILEYFRNLAGK